MTASDDPASADAGGSAPEDRQRLEALVSDCIEAMERGDPDPVSRICAEAPDLRSRVEQRLRHLAARGLIELPPGARPERVGPYRIVAELGSGGMGTVYLAEQSEPVQRQVALKVIRLGMDTQEVVARFEAERQALALMSHPNVAQVFDAGATDDGRPYFAMEYVAGEPITVFCDRRRLPLPERLRLLAAVCRAVQHAHERGVIHRDLKPSNLLVAELGDQAVPTVIDFGVAKATGPGSASSAMRTRVEAVLGTPEYMSPEQACSGGLDVDIRSDVYSLGVVLYELLCGALPFDSARLRRVGRRELERILLEEEPASPSRALAAAPAAVLAARGGERGALRRRMQGELDWIVGKAIAKDRGLRYPSALALAEDLERWLRHAPVLAAPPRAGYRLRKFVRRHRVAVAAAAAVAAALVTGLGLSLSAAADARAARRQEALAHDDTRAFFALARDAVASLVDVADQRLAGMPRAEPVRQALLDDAMEFYRALSARQPRDPGLQLEVLAAQEKVGMLQRQLGRVQDSAATLQACVDAVDALCAAVPDQPGPLRLRISARASLSTALAVLGQDAAARTQRQLALAELPRLRQLTGRQHDGADLAGTLWNGLGVDSADEPARALHCFDQAVASFDAALAAAPPAARRGTLEVLRARCLGHRGTALVRLRRPREAEAAMRGAIAELERLQTAGGCGDLRAPLARARDQLARLLRRLERPEQAEAEVLAARDLLERLVDDHPDVPLHQDELGAALDLLADLAQSQGRLSDALAHYAQAVAVRTRVAEQNPQNLNFAMLRVRSLLNQVGALAAAWQRGLVDLSDAAAAAEQAVAAIDPVWQQRPGDAEVGLTFAGAHESLATIRDLQERRAEALVEHGLARSTLEQLAAASPDNVEVRIQLVFVCNNLVMAHLAAGDAVAAAAAGAAAWQQVGAVVERDAANPRLRGVVSQVVARRMAAQQRAGDAAGALDSALALARAERLPQRLRALGAMLLAEAALGPERAHTGDAGLQLAEQELRAALARDAAAAADESMRESGMGMELHALLGDVLGSRGDRRSQADAVAAALRAAADRPRVPAEHLRAIYAQAAECALALDDAPAAVRHLDTMVAQIGDDGGARYLAAVLFTRCAERAAAPGERDALAARAVECLGLALRAGATSAAVLTQPQFAALRERADFQALGQGR